MGTLPGAEAFVDQLITWRELGYNFAFHREDHYSIDSIPEWASNTLSDHTDDRRQSYTFEEIEAAETEDEVWNAAQRQLKEEGLIHNYLRMLWKRILEWAPSPSDAADWMIKLNDRWALDGRDPNSYTEYSGSWAGMTGHGAPRDRFLEVSGICPLRTPSGN